MIDKNLPNYFEKDFHTKKYKIETVLRIMSSLDISNFTHLNSFCINAFRGGEIK